jgi:hypothetical protein
MCGDRAPKNRGEIATALSANPANSLEVVRLAQADYHSGHDITQSDGQLGKHRDQTPSGNQGSHRYRA